MVQRFHVSRPSSQPPNSAKYLFVGTAGGLTRTGGRCEQNRAATEIFWYVRADAAEASLQVKINAEKGAERLVHKRINSWIRPCVRDGARGWSPVRPWGVRQVPSIVCGVFRVLRGRSRQTQKPWLGVARRGQSLEP